MARGPAAWIVAAVAIALAGCAEDSGVSVDCGSAVLYGGGVYYGNAYAGRAGSIPRGERIGTAIVPKCGPGTERVPVSVSRLRGIDPRVALAVTREKDAVYLAEGFLPQLAGHPVNKALGSAGAAPPRRCRGRFRFSGTIRNVSPLYVRNRDGEEAFEIHARTRVSGFTRAGQPYLRAGDEVVIRGRVCAGRTRYADRIAPAS
jgi:hypothetical protein